MIPIPPALLALYPPALNRHPTRPWWRLYPAGEHGYLVSHWVRPARPSCRVGLDIEATGMDAELARIDRAHPLPFPGVRVGCVFAYPSVDGEWHVKMIVDVHHADRPSRHFIGASVADECFLLAGPGAPWAPAEPA